MNNGFIKLHREILESKIFASEKGLKIWIWMLLKASYSKRFVNIKIGKGESTVTLQRGELLFGRFSAEETLGIDGSTIYKHIKKMEELEMVTLKSNSHYTIINISNYDTYNSLNQVESSNQVTTNEQPSNSQVTTEEHIQESKESKEGKESKEVVKPKKSKLDIVREFYAKELDKAAQEGAGEYLQIVRMMFDHENQNENPYELLTILEQQLTFEQYKKLTQIRDKKTTIKDAIIALENFKAKAKYKSVYLTLNNWLK